MRKLASAWFALGCALLAIPAFASITDGVNQIRRKGCNRQPGVSQSLRTSRALNAVAREWSKGGRLREALARTDYRGANSASMQVEGARDEQAVLDVLEEHYCDTITDPTFKEIGVYERDRSVWIVVALPRSLPSTKDAAKVSQKVLTLVNAARVKSRKCGRTSFDAVLPLKLSATLSRAALLHSQDMANKNFFEHRGSDGSQVGDRATRVGYRWRIAGENIAIGAENADVVVQGWLDSPGHCANIMSPAFTEMGLAYVVERDSAPGIYWTQVFAAPR